MATALMLAVPSWPGFAQQPSFDVASVKSGRPTGSLQSTVGPSGPGPTIDPTSFSAHRKSLAWLIQTAYGLQQYQVSGGPSWVTSDPWDVDARAGSPSTPQQILVMLQTLLADRFQLVFRRETRDIQLNVLTVAKGGPRFGTQFRLIADDAPPLIRGTSVLNQIGPSRMTMKLFASILQLNLSRDLATGTSINPSEVPPVLDHTEPAGTFEITLKTAGETDWSQLLQRQLGLRVDLRKVPMQMIIIETAAKPLAN
jgi:uncharacterized protein (TIGR03435 family)